MLKNNCSHRSPSSKIYANSAPWKEQQYLQSKHKEIDPLFHEIDSQQYEPSLRYRPFSLNTWDNILLDNNINVPLVLRKLYAQRLFGFAILHDCTLAEIHPEEFMKILYTLMLYDFEQKNVVYMKKLMANPAVFPQQVLHLIGNVH